MTKIICLLFILTSCSTAPMKAPTISTGHAVQKHLFYEVKGAGDVLKNTNAATIGVWIRPHAVASSNEDIFNVSVGSGKEAWKTRAGFRVIQNGAFQSVARSDDLEELSEITTATGLEVTNKWQHVTLTIDYTNKIMVFYVNGNVVPTLSANYRFTKPVTSDTNSFFVTLGSEDDGRNAFFNGDLAGAFVERRILSLEEIQSVMAKTRP